MNINQFWEIIEAAKEKAQGDLDAQVAQMTAALDQLDAEEILAWQQMFNEYQRLSYKSKLWAAAYIINGGCSDDGFDYFRGWLTAQGRNVFLAALRDPDSLADLVEVEEGEAEFEDMLGAASSVYLKKLNLGRDYARFHKDLKGHPLSDSDKTTMLAEIRYQADIDEDWHDDEELKKQLPRLCETYDW